LGSIIIGSIVFVCSFNFVQNPTKGFELNEAAAKSSLSFFFLKFYERIKFQKVGKMIYFLCAKGW
jgi:uncharacterized membrane protein (UPF0136 family)